MAVNHEKNADDIPADTIAAHSSVEWVAPEPTQKRARRDSKPDGVGDSVATQGAMLSSDRQHLMMGKRLAYVSSLGRVQNLHGTISTPQAMINGRRVVRVYGNLYSAKRCAKRKRD